MTKPSRRHHVNPCPACGDTQRVPWRYSEGIWSERLSSPSWWDRMVRFLTALWTYFQPRGGDPCIGYWRGSFHRNW